MQRTVIDGNLIFGNSLSLDLRPDGYQPSGTSSGGHIVPYRSGVPTPISMPIHDENYISVPDGEYKGILIGSEFRFYEYNYPPFQCPIQYAILGEAPVTLVVRNNRFDLVGLKQKREYY